MSRGNGRGECILRIGAVTRGGGHNQNASGPT
jgi:hypothetical protein